MLMSNFRRNYFYWGGGRLKAVSLSDITHQCNVTHGTDSVSIFLSYKYLPTLIFGLGGVSTNEINFDDIHGYIFTHV